MSSLFFKFKSKFSQRYIAYILCFACNSQIPRAKRTKGWPITVCNSPKSYSSPFCNLSKGNGVPLTIWEKLVRNCMRYTVYFWAFSKRALLPFSDVAKGNRWTFGKKQADYSTFCKLAAGWLSTFKKLFPGGRDLLKVLDCSCYSWTAQRMRNKQNNNLQFTPIRILRAARS